MFPSPPCKLKSSVLALRIEPFRWVKYSSIFKIGAVLARIVRVETALYDHNSPNSWGWNALSCKLASRVGFTDFQGRLNWHQNVQNSPMMSWICPRGCRAHLALWGWNRSFQFTVHVLAGVLPIRFYFLVGRSGVVIMLIEVRDRPCEINLVNSFAYVGCMQLLAIFKFLLYRTGAGCANISGQKAKKIKAISNSSNSAEQLVRCFSCQLLLARE